MTKVAVLVTNHQQFLHFVQGLPAPVLHIPAHARAVSAGKDYRMVSRSYDLWETDFGEFIPLIGSDPALRREAARSMRQARAAEV